MWTKGKVKWVLWQFPVFVVQKMPVDFLVISTVAPLLPDA